MEGQALEEQYLVGYQKELEEDDDEYNEKWSRAASEWISWEIFYIFINCL